MCILFEIWNVLYCTHEWGLEAYYTAAKALLVTDFYTLSLYAHTLLLSLSPRRRLTELSSRLVCTWCKEDKGTPRASFFSPIFVEPYWYILLFSFLPQTDDTIHIHLFMHVQKNETHREQGHGTNAANVSVFLPCQLLSWQREKVCTIFFVDISQT